MPRNHRCSCCREQFLEKICTHNHRHCNSSHEWLLLVTKEYVRRSIVQRLNLSPELRLQINTHHKGKSMPDIRCNFHCQCCLQSQSVCNWKIRVIVNPTPTTMEHHWWTHRYSCCTRWVLKICKMVEWLDGMSRSDYSADTQVFKLTRSRYNSRCQCGLVVSVDSEREVRSMGMNLNTSNNDVSYHL